MAISIMQGRLVPPIDGRIQTFPRDRWHDEFACAAEAGLDGIEWIFDEAGEAANPIRTDIGLARMRDLGARHGIQVHSLCADYFMDRPLLRVSGTELDDRMATFAWLLGRCSDLQMHRVVVPFVDASRIDTVDEMRAVAEVLTALLGTAEAAGVELHLETSLDPAAFANLLNLIPHPMVKVNYDAGNSASLGYAPAEEFAAYGDRVGSVHIKDRVLGGSTVALGSGSTDFDSLFACLAKRHYEGDFVLQVARGTDGDEVAWARRNLEFVQAHMSAAG